MKISEEDLLRHLCVRAARIMREGADTIFVPPETIEDFLTSLEYLYQSCQHAHKLIEAALALADM